MKLNNLSASAFADEIGVQRSGISHILSGRNKPSLELIQKVLAKYPKISADWLITGNTKIDSSDLISSPTITVQDEKTSTTPTPSTRNTNKQIKKVVIFYTDNTFEEIISGY
jgi:transcriptional regulator with XRE-family HTH domain